VVNFKNTIIIMTSNLGSHLIMDAFERIEEKSVEEVMEKTKVEVMGLLRQTVRPEFLNRVDEIILFQPLLRSEIQGIVKIQLQGLAALLAESGIQLRFSDYALAYLSEQGFDPQFGARPLKRLIQKQIVNPLSKKILAGEVDRTQPVLVDVFDQTVVFRNEPLAKPVV
jgi:ATP-dependent Clp protease ATP-binding subunit ClpB